MAQDPWSHYQKVVLFRLDDMSEKTDSIQAELRAIHIALAQINTHRKITSALFGFFAGLVPTAISVAFEIFSK